MYVREMAKHPISDGLRHALRAAEVSRYRISKDTGISQTTLSRFLAGERGLELAAADQLAAYLGLALRSEK